jgi:3-oxoacyl-[acyl-carrier-protein] synthase-3
MPCLLLINILKREYKNVLVIGSEVHSTGLDMTSRGRCIGNFGDGAGAAVLSREEDLTKGILSTHLHSEGQHAEELILRHQEWVVVGLLIL